MREAYRKNKSTLYDQLLAENTQIAFFVILKGNAVPDYLTLEKSMKDMINRLIANIKSNTNMLPDQ